ncbi:MAG: secretion system protein E [Betaproteobacteria bacterium RIFCSPLOWO2_12_FULL_67_28]|nr:MAG: secretion system protein E [Betaproteobacteria bacterium RIFCSPLOWO2_02_FULL_68_150]OGA72403.1 MAG: secretion system protein E [Betaproteobacteria bacterium RIFCSPLOWO2_12_FULL_67_28]
MSAVLSQQSSTQPDVSARLASQKQLQSVTNKIHATSNIDEIMLELSAEICTLFNADRLTIYSLAEDKQSIVSKLKTGLNSFKDLKLPVAEHSIAGYVALSRKMVNIRDVYDDAELKAINPNLRFLQEVDKRTGYRTKQMLVAPIMDVQAQELVGVIQLINSKAGMPFGHVTEEGVAELAQTLAIAFKQRQRPQAVRTKYAFLITDAVLSAGEYELAARQARKKALDIEQVLIEEFQVRIPALGQALSKFFGVPYEAFKPERIKPLDLLKNLKREYVEQNQWLPIDDTKEGLVVLCLDPERIRSSRIAANVFPKAKIVYRVATQKDFKETINQFYGAESVDSGDIGEMLAGLDDETGESIDSMSSDDVSAAADNELVKLVNKVIIDAYNQGATDIHIEPYPGKAKTEIRFRKDGALGPYIEVPASYRNAIVARIKIMCDLDISEKRKPQDGKIKFKKFGPLDIELRVATIPTQGGVEDIVMRVLAAGEPIPLEKLGLTKLNEQNLKKTVEKPYGLFFVCGPTGSGKTTTLHSVLKYLNTPDTKIWTAEDPVEITQKGLRQVQVNKKAGLDFAAVMRAFLRADPDIIMVGEMRDKETTGTGIEASLTGHLVFATLHTNSAPESIIRLLDMGMDPFNFSDALLGILAQRLAKRLCSCKQPYTPEAAEIKSLLSEYCEELLNTETFKRDPKAAMENVYKDWLKNYGNERGQLTLYKIVGCDKCGGNGFKGRCGLHELLVASDALKKLIQEHARVAQIVAVALEEGMRTLKQDGIEKVLMGITHMKEVRAVCIK